jgi:hypothetical protein
MRVSRLLPVLAVAASAAIVMTGSMVTAAEAATLHSAARPAPAAPPAQLAPLREFRTAGDAGWFYTLNATEADDAVRRFKFTSSATIGSLYTAPVPGAVAVHRLRAKTGGPSYLLSVSPAEIGDPRFQDEGVLGYVDGGQRPGEVRLLRFSNHGKWRVLADGPANVNNMRAEGYTVDGPLGWFHP